MTSAKELSTPDWRKLSIDQPYHDPTRREYCIVVSTDVGFVTEAHMNLSDNAGPLGPLKRTVKDQGIKNLAKFYNKVDGVEDVQTFGELVEQYSGLDNVAQRAGASVRILDFYMDSRPCSRLRYLVGVDEEYFGEVPQKPREPLESTPVAPVEEIVVYKLPELKGLLDSVAGLFLELSQNITTARPGLDFVQEAGRLQAVYPSVLDLLYKNGFRNEEISGLSIRFDFGPAVPDEEPTLENCLMTDEIINVGVQGTDPGFEELLISKLTFLNNAPIKYARTRKNLRNLKHLDKQKDCPENFGIWGRDDWWSPPASWYHALDTTRNKVEGVYEVYEKHAGSRRGRQIIDRLRDRQVWPYNGRKKIKTREEYEAERRGTPTEEDKKRIEKEMSKEYDFVGSVLFSAQKQNELIDEIQTASDAYDRVLSRFDTEYLERILLRLALDSLGIEDINQLIFEKVLGWLDHDALWGPKGLVANCIPPERKGGLEELVDPTPGCEDPDAAVKEEILELLGRGALSAEALQTCLQTVCPPATRMFGLKKQIEGLLAYATSDLIPYDRDELCPDPPEDEHPWQGIKFDRFEYDFPNMSNLADTTMALYEEFKKALEDTWDELLVGIVKQLLRMLIENIERILCNWTDMKSFGTALAKATVEGELLEEIGGFAEEEIWKNNIVAGVKSAISDWGFDPEEFYPTDDPADPRTYDQRLADFVNEVYACLNPGEFRAVMRGVELGQNLQIIEMATAKSLSCISPGDMLGIMGQAGQGLDIPGPQDDREPRHPGESICDPTYANEVEQNFRDSYAGRADEEVIQRLWDKEIQELKNTVRQLMSLLDDPDPGCQEDLAPSFGDNDFNRNMQQNASNTMLSPVTEAFERNISDWAADIFRVRPPIDLGDPPPPNAEMIMAAFEQDESVIEFVKNLLDPAAAVAVIGPENPCSSGERAINLGTALYMYPNCHIRAVEGRQPNALEFFLRRNRVGPAGPLVEIPLPDGPMYDSLEADPRFREFFFDDRIARQVSSEQYVFSNFLLATLFRAIRKSLEGDDMSLNVSSGLMTTIQKNLYRDIVNGINAQTLDLMHIELAKFEADDTKEDSNLYAPLNEIKTNPTGISDLLEIEEELQLINEGFEQKTVDMSSAERLETPPLQTVSVLPLVRVLIRVSVVEKLFGLLPILPTAGFENVRRSPIFVETMIRLVGDVIKDYEPPLEAIGVDVEGLLGSGEEGVSLEDFVTQELEKILIKMEEVLDSRSSFFEELPLISVPAKAGAEHIFRGTDSIYDPAAPDQLDVDVWERLRHGGEGHGILVYEDVVLVDDSGRRGDNFDPELEESVAQPIDLGEDAEGGGPVEHELEFYSFRPDPYPMTFWNITEIDFSNYDSETLFDFTPRELDVWFEGVDDEGGRDHAYAVTKPGKLSFKDGKEGHFIFEKYIEFEPLDEEEFSGLLRGHPNPSQRDALRYIRNAFEELLVDSSLSRTQVESVEVFRSLFKRAVLNAFIQFNEFGKTAWSPGYSVEQHPFEWPVWEDNPAWEDNHRREIQLLRKLELDFFVVQSFDNEVSTQSLNVAQQAIRAGEDPVLTFGANLHGDANVDEILDLHADAENPDGALSDIIRNKLTADDLVLIGVFNSNIDYDILNLQRNILTINSALIDQKVAIAAGWDFRSHVAHGIWRILTGRDITVLRELSPFVSAVSAVGEGGFWGNFQLNNIFKNLKTGVRLSFIHTDVDFRDGELGFFTALDEGLDFGDDRFFDRELLDGGFPEGDRPEWARYCNIKKAYDIFLQEEGTEFGRRARRIMTIPMVEQENSIINLTMANFYGEKGLLDPVTGHQFTFDGRDAPQFFNPQGFTIEDGPLAQRSPAVEIDLDGLAGLPDSEIHDFEGLRREMVDDNFLFKVFSNFAVPFDDILSAIVANTGQEVSSSGFEILKETKRNIMLMLYAMSPSVSANAVGDLDASREWLLRYFP